MVVEFGLVGFTLVFQRDELISDFKERSAGLILLNLPQVLLDTIRVDQAFLEVLSSIVHGEASGHLLLYLDHVVEDFNSKVFVTLEVDRRVRCLPVKAFLAKTRPTLIHPRRRHGVSQRALAHGQCFLATRTSLSLEANGGVFI